MKKKDKIHLEDLKNYLLKAEERVKYSLERFDVLIISLSSGGLILALNLFKNFQSDCIDKNLLSLSWLFFSVALIINLLSQVTGYFANKYDIKGTRNEIYEIEKKTISGNSICIELYQKVFNHLTKWLNVLSFLSLSTGIILLILFINLKV